MNTDDLYANDGVAGHKDEDLAEQPSAAGEMKCEANASTFLFKLVALLALTLAIQPLDPAISPYFGTKITREDIRMMTMGWRWDQTPECGRPTSMRLK